MVDKDTRTLSPEDAREESLDDREEESLWYVTVSEFALLYQEELFDPESEKIASLESEYDRKTYAESARFYRRQLRRLSATHPNKLVAPYELIRSVSAEERMKSAEEKCDDPESPVTPCDLLVEAAFVQANHISLDPWLQPKPPLHKGYIREVQDRALMWIHEEEDRRESPREKIRLLHRIHYFLEYQEDHDGIIERVLKAVGRSLTEWCEAEEHRTEHTFHSPERDETQSIHERRARAVAKLASKDFDSSEELAKAVNEEVGDGSTSTDSLRKSLKKLQLGDGRSVYVGAGQGASKKERALARRAMMRRAEKWCKENPYSDS